MGYRGKLAEREQAEALRAAGWTMPDIASHLGVSRSSVSLWTRDIECGPGPRRTLRPTRPNTLAQRKRQELESTMADGRRWIGRMTEREFLVAGVALYAGEGSKRDGFHRLRQQRSSHGGFVLCLAPPLFPGR
ncbi:MAG: helix-turn-helix domain-containing protein [Acidimicrobiales bacterium]